MKIRHLFYLPALVLGLAVPAAAQQGHVNLDWNPQARAEGLLPFGAVVLSPEVHPDRTITFRVQAPQARSILLEGGPMLLALGEGTKPIPFEAGEDGVWSLTVGPVAPNLYIYKVRIDGALGPDPNNTFTWAAAQPGYSTVVVPGDGPAYYDARNVPHGAVTRHVYHSDVTDGQRELFVYTPPGYDSTREYPVLYLLGGSGELAGGWDYDGRASFIADNLLADGRMEPTVIVMPNNQVIHRRHPEHTALTFDLFERELIQEILPFVESAYRVRTDRRGRALAGLSMGGRHAQLVGFKHLDAFASFGILSAGIAPEAGDTPEWVSNPAGFNDRIDYLFVGLGTYEDTPTNRSVAFHQALEKHGIEHDYYIGGNGGHDWGTWRDHLHYMLPKLWRAD